MRVTPNLETSMTDQDQALRDLLDREAIRDLPLRYCDFVWHDDVDGIVSLFTDDGAFVVRMPGSDEMTAKGTPHLHEFYAGGLGMQPRPYIHNHVVDLVDAEHATGRCYLDLRSAKNDMAWLGAGHYADEYRKVDGRWKFASRVFTAVRMLEDPTGNQ